VSVVDTAGVSTPTLTGPPLDALPWVFTDPVWDRGGCRMQWTDSEVDVFDPRYRWSPSLMRLAQVQLPDLLGETLIDVWPKDLYTAEFVAGPTAGVMAAAANAQINQHTDQLMDYIDAIAAPSPRTIEQRHDTPTIPDRGSRPSSRTGAPRRQFLT
jgi:hypothetical protein